MDAKTAPRKENSTSPKPSTATVVNSLIQTKDEVHTKLLEETKKSADLSNIFTTLDDQLRAAIDKTLRNLKTELEKQRKRLVPGIRRLEDASKSLKKSETILEGHDNYHRNADVKKASRRIKDAKRVVQEFPPSNSDLGIHSYIAEQITSLCQRIRQIPLFINDSEFKTKYNIPTDKSLGSSSDSFGSRKTSPQPNIRRIGKENASHKQQKRFSSHTKTLNGVEMFSSDTDTLDENFDTGQYIPIKVQRQSNTEYNETETGESIYAEIGDESRHSSEYLTPLEARQAQADRDTPERTRWRQGISNTSTPDRNKIPFSKYFDENKTELKESDVKRNGSKPDNDYITTRKPLPLPRKAKTNEVPAPLSAESKATGNNSADSTSPKQYSESRSVEEIVVNESKTSDFKAYAYAKAKGIPKRLLPSVPKTTKGNTKPYEYPYSTVTNNGSSADQLDGRVNNISAIDSVDSPGNHKLNKKRDTELRDMEELQFKESVQTCRQNIIDRLKERYAIHPSYRRTPSPDITYGRSDSSPTWDIDNGDNSYVQISVSDNEVRRNSDLYLQTARQTKHLSRSMGSTAYTQGDGMSFMAGPSDRSIKTDPNRIKSPNTHWSKLVIINNYSPTPDNPTVGNRSIENALGYATVNKNQPSSDSIVTKGIMKFENTVQPNGASRRYSLPKGNLWKHSPVRPRSISAEGVPLKTTRYRYKSSSNLYALAPRSREPIQTADNSLDALSLRHMGSIESDLDKLCNESKRSIRQEWYQRRSQSLQNPPKTPEKAKSRHSFVYHSSFRIPDHKAERCHISSIVMMSDGKVVVLDQRHRRVYTFDRHYTFLNDCPILEFPGSMVALRDDTIAIAYPYKSKCGVYRVGVNGTIQFQRDILSPCSKWVNDIGFAKGHLYLLCKGGDVHIITTENTELKTISAGMNGRILVHPGGRRFYIIGEGRITKFNAEGAMLSSIEHVGAYSLILLNDTLYAVDRQKHMIVSIKFGLGEENDLIGKVDNPAAVCVSATGEQLLVSQFEESIDIQKTRTIHVYKLENKQTSS